MFARSCVTCNMSDSSDLVLTKPEVKMLLAAAPSHQNYTDWPEEQINVSYLLFFATDWKY